MPRVVPDAAAEAAAANMRLQLASCRLKLADVLMGTEGTEDGVEGGGREEARMQLRRAVASLQPLAMDAAAALSKPTGTDGDGPSAPEQMVEALHHFDYRQHELVVFHLLAEEELSFPFQTFQRFHDLEGVEEMLRIDPQAVRAAYLKKLREFIASIESVCGNLRADYVPVITKTPAPEALVRFLGGRQR